MYSEKFVVAIKCDGKILREDGDSVFMPFGKQFTVLLKNLNTLDAQVKVEIDGELVAANVFLRGNTSVEFDGYQLGDKTGRCFKFIKTTEQIQAHRGTRIDDGLIRVEYDFAREPIQYPVQQFQYYPQGIFYPQRINTFIDKHPVPLPIWCSNAATAATVSQVQNQTLSANAIGITVPGSETKLEPVTTKTVSVQNAPKAIILRMVGEVNAKHIEKPKLVVERKKCPICGTVNKNAKFCRSCGTGIW